jgi:hypothetical protein
VLVYCSYLVRAYPVPSLLCSFSQSYSYPHLPGRTQARPLTNVISGFGKIAGAALASHMDVDKVAFTGSTIVGRQILRAAAGSNLKKVTLELGGKSPNIVFDDADIENAISWVNFGIFFNHGQCCCAGSRIYVQAGIYDRFVERFKARATANKVGDPFKAETFQGHKYPNFNTTESWIILRKARRKAPRSRLEAGVIAIKATSLSLPSSQMLQKA